MWAGLTQAQRAKAIQRMTALDRVENVDVRLDANTAAADAGMKLTRFYEVAKAWRQRRSLASLGTFAAAPRTRVSAYDAHLRGLLPEVVAADPDGSVRKLALDLEAASGLAGDARPSHNTFRRYVEEALRKRGRRASAGAELLLDCAACTLTPHDDALFCLFAVMDRWTHVVLGAALGDAADSRSGYARAAQDALRRLRAGRFDRLPWVDRMKGGVVVVGLDVEAWRNAREAFRAAGVAAPIEPSTSDDRFGRYYKSVSGLRIGRVTILPRRTPLATAAGGATPDDVIDGDRQARLMVEVDDYDAACIADLPHEDVGSPPADLPALLQVLARG